MPAPLPNNLRVQIIDAHERGEGSLRELASRFGVSRSTVYRYISKPSDEPPRRLGRSPKLDEAGLALLRRLAQERPLLSGEELAALLYERTGVRLSRSSVHYALRSMGLARRRGPRPRHLLLQQEPTRLSA